ncbi:MAG: hypothetical protein JWQ42_4713 [Edaphobacter sp.]|nr:hypothetical protein [Edaphobacter sp.]
MSLRFAIPGIELTERSTSRKVRARFTDLTPERATELVAPWWDEQSWNEEGLFVAEDNGWNWPKFAADSIGQGLPDCVGILTPEDGQIQGALWLDVAVPSLLCPNQQALHIQRLATAPRNREGVAEEPRFKAAGRALMLYSITYSYAFGLEGRITLSSLEGAQSFYEGLGLIDTRELDHQDLKIFEVTPLVAQRMLKTYHLL